MFSFNINDYHNRHQLTANVEKLIMKQLLKSNVKQALLVSILATSAFTSSSQADEWEVNLGLGAASVDSAWKGLDSESFIIPMIQAQYGPGLLALMASIMKCLTMK